MAAVTAVATIVAALVSGGSQIWAANKENQAVAQAGREAKRLATLERGDTLAQNRVANELSRQSQRLSEQTFRFNKQEALADRKMATERFGMEKLQNQANTAMGIVNNNDTLRQNLANRMIGRRL